MLMAGRADRAESGAPRPEPELGGGLADIGPEECTDGGARSGARFGHGGTDAGAGARVDAERARLGGLDVPALPEPPVRVSIFRTSAAASTGRAKKPVEPSERTRAMGHPSSG